MDENTKVPAMSIEQHWHAIIDTNGRITSLGSHVHQLGALTHYHPQEQHIAVYLGERLAMDGKPLTAVEYTGDFA